MAGRGRRRTSGEQEYGDEREEERRRRRDRRLTPGEGTEREFEEEYGVSFALGTETGMEVVWGRTREARGPAVASAGRQTSFSRGSGGEGRAPPSSWRSGITPGQGTQGGGPAGGAGGVPETRLSGQYLAAMLQFAAEQDSPDRLSGEMDDALREASVREQGHEIIALGESQLVMNDGNWMRFQQATDPDRAMLVVSFLGDTSAGKSHTIRQLMGQGEDRPYCQPSGRQSNATTFNVNLYLCETIADDVTVHFVDYEGENGSETPVMAAARTLSLSGRASQARYKAVTEFFPKLAYTTSDVLVIVSREPFFNRRYLERCITLAKRANAGVVNVERPALILIGNKLPGEECETDIRRSTAQFFEAWNEPARQLDQYFSTVICMYIPHKRGFWRDEHDRVVDGKVVFDGQVQNLRRILRVLAQRRLGSGPQLPGVASAQRQITQHQGLWFALLPRVLEELNAGRGVDVSRLIDQVWAEAMARTAPEAEAELDMFKAFLTFLRPNSSLSLSAPRFNEDLLLRFDSFRQLALDVAVRLVACRLRSLDRAVLLASKMEAYARSVLEGVATLIDDITPCAAVYDPRHQRGTAPAERPDEPVLCLQERRHHSVHRTSRRVVGGAGMWGRLLGSWPYNESWEGVFVSPHLTPSDLSARVEQAVRWSQLPETEFLEELLTLQETHNGSLISLGFVPLGVTRGVDYSNSAPTSPPEPVRPEVHSRLRLLPTLSAPASMPYCIACGLKFTRRRSPHARHEETPPSQAHAEVQSGAWIASVTNTLWRLVGGSDRSDDGGEEGGGAAHALESGALTESELWVATRLAAPEAVSPEAVEASVRALEEAWQLPTMEADPDMVCQHIWLGVCPRCWEGLFLLPAQEEMRRERGVAPGPRGAPEFD